jgi:hypothetical protein
VHGHAFLVEVYTLNRYFLRKYDSFFRRNMRNEIQIIFLLFLLKKTKEIVQRKRSFQIHTSLSKGEKRYKLKNHEKVLR